MPNTETYNDQIVRLFLLAAAVWGVAGMAIGVFVAAQLAWPALNFDTSWLTFSRLRPNHTFGVIFAFGGSAVTLIVMWRSIAHIAAAKPVLADDQDVKEP